VIDEPSSPRPVLALSTTGTFDRDSAKLLARALLTPVVALCLYFWTPLDESNWILSAGLGILATILVIPYAFWKVGRIRQALHPLGEALAVLALLVSLVIVGFAGGYYSMSIYGDGFPAIHTRMDALYFTVVTLGTVGYGDIAPVSQGARAVVSFQILVNLSLIATLIRLLGRVATESRSARMQS
jgi:voltage-gated potassium channel